MTAAEWLAVVSALSATLLSGIGVYRSFRSDLRAEKREDAMARKDTVDDLQKQVDRLQETVQGLTERLAAQTRYIGYLQYVLMKNGIETPTFDEWRSAGEIERPTPRRGGANA